MTCSQLSRTSSARCDCRAVTIDAVNVRPRLSLTSRTLATARGTSLEEPCAGQLDEPCAATPGGAGVDVGPVGRGQGEPRLADPSRPHERDDRGRGRAPSPMSSRSSSRPISRPRRRGRFPRRLSSVRSGGCSPSPSWRMRCSPTTPSRRNVPRSRRLAAVEQRRRHAGHQRLAAVTGGGEPRRDDHGRTEVALSPLLGLTGVQPDPHPDLDVRRATARPSIAACSSVGPGGRRRWPDGRPRRTSRHRWRRRTRRDDRPRP